MAVVLRKLPIQGTAHGSPWMIFTQGTENQCEVLEYLADQKKSSPRTFKKMTAILEHAAKAGPQFQNTEKCEQLKGMKEAVFLEFKAKVKGGQNARIFGFVDEGRFIICTHGFSKKTEKTPEKQKDKLKKRYNSYMQAKHENKITIIEDLQL